MISDYLLKHLNKLKITDVSQLMSEMLNFFHLSDGKPNNMYCGELMINGYEHAQLTLEGILKDYKLLKLEDYSAISKDVLDTLLKEEIMLNGAEVAVLIMASEGIKYVFAYPGTSELALCDMANSMSSIQVINGRGDKETSFMAAGASLISSNLGAAILHGARGLTNATGAIADVRRSEIGTLFIVGLPSCKSSRFLPPHGEDNLFDGMDAFVDWSWQASAIPTNSLKRNKVAYEFISKLHEALKFTATSPYKPALFGVPQDVAEEYWISLRMLAKWKDSSDLKSSEPINLDIALNYLEKFKKPVFLVDDYALKYEGVKPLLNQIANQIGAPVMQLRYRRGPMLFERIHYNEIDNFIGWLNPFSAMHTEILNSCDLLITIEDRNMYNRVVGPLPKCTKMAINSNPEKVYKNEYLDDENDIVISGNPMVILKLIADNLSNTIGIKKDSWFPISENIRLYSNINPEPASDNINKNRNSVVKAIAEVLNKWEKPIVVDDSQMFGGMISEYYDNLPNKLRVFGSHGAFVGSGLSYAVGLSIANEDIKVMCTLGDQGFTNAFQGLVAAIQQQAQVMFIVCNNGESVSLKKQANTSYGLSGRNYLNNVANFNYATVAKAFGVVSEKVVVNLCESNEIVEEDIKKLSLSLDNLSKVKGPTLLELVLPSDSSAWEGIWITKGFDQKMEVRCNPSA